MLKKMSKQMSKPIDKPLSGWGLAILDTEKEIQKIKEEIRDKKEKLAELRVALKVFQEKLDKGEPFPGQPRVGKDDAE
jgi:hypothetical protein